MATTDTIQTARRHGLPIPTFARDAYAPGRASCNRGWVSAVELLDAAIIEAGARAARRLADYYAGSPVLPRKRQIIGRKAILVDDMTRPDRSY